VLLRANAAEALFELGRWDEASELVAEGLSREPTGSEGLAIRVVAARLAAARGEVGAARDHLGQARRMAHPGPAPMTSSRLPIVGAEVALQENHLDEVRVAVDDALRGITRGGSPLDVVTVASIGLRAEADAAQRARVRADEGGWWEAHERAERLVRTVSRASPKARIPPGSVLEALVRLCAAEHARVKGRSSPAVWEALSESWERLARPVAGGYAALRAAEAHLAAAGKRGSRAAAGSVLRTAVRLIEPVGATALLIEVRDLARRARLPLEEAPGEASEAGAEAASAESDHLGLTDRELEVLALLAEGRTNRQIGEALFISPKTVSVHVSNVIGKLRVSGRVEAATLALRLGLIPTGRAPDRGSTRGR
jgi:DNA-binding CsgD family transcriptional regulator